MKKTETPKQEKEVIVPGPEASADLDPTKPKFDPDELSQIFDEIMFSGEYTEEITIRKKLKVFFRSRTAEETTLISREIDGKNYSLITTLHEDRAILNLAYSIVSYAGKDLSNTGIDERKKFINKLPAVVISILSLELNKFDYKIEAACKDGEANF